MVGLKLVFLASVTMATLASPVHESESYIQSSIGHVISHAPSSSRAPLLTYTHEPVITYSHAPVALQHAPVEIEDHAPAQYEFKYGVRDDHTHDIKEQAEKRIGDKVEGYYKLLEADGTTRTVHYTADKHTGFHAQVVRAGHAAHPAAAPAHKVVAAPVLTYTHSAAPVISYGTDLGAYH